MDEYQIEIRDIRRQLAKLKADEAAPVLIEEYEAQLRNLMALYAAATQTVDAGAADARMRAALLTLGYGDWTLANVYSFVYDTAMEADPDDRDLANLITHLDYAGALLVATPLDQN